MKEKATAIYNRLTHVSRVLTGLRMLEDNGLLEVTYIENQNNEYNLPDGPLVEVRINNKRIAFDMGDRWALNNYKGKEYLGRVDYYFARGYSTKVDIVTPEIFTDNPKVKPFGLYYYVTYPKNPLDKKPGIKNSIRALAKHISGFYKYSYPYAFESKADQRQGNLKIIFMTRLWGTQEFDAALNSNISQTEREYIHYMCKERDGINSQRIEVMRALKKEYRDSFIGGVSDDELSRELCPDLVVPPAETSKITYMNKVKSADICIGTTGLHRSIGGKVGEYVAASKAIVTEKLEYEVPGRFEEGKCFLSFSTVDECLKAVDHLYNNSQLVNSMKKANECYYKDYVNPKKQVLNALQIAGVNLCRLED